jgi:hypothetical protein
MANFVFTPSRKILASATISPTVSVFGKALPGSLTSEPVWEILRIEIDDNFNLVSGLYASDGSRTLVFDDHLTYTYS